MKQVFAETGGRPFTNDDLLTLQNELTAAVQAQFLNKGPFILSGCQVSGSGPSYNVAAGIICLDGQLLRYPGAGAVTLPAQFQAGAAVLTDPRPYQTGGTKNCMREVPAVLGATDPAYTGGEFLPLDTWGGKRWEHIVKAQQHEPGDVKLSSNLVTALFDLGVGKPGTSAWGWALCDGQNGRIDLSEKFIACYNGANPAYAVGATGGEAQVKLEIQHIPQHSHGLDLSFGQSNGGQSTDKMRTDSRFDGALNRSTTPVGGGQTHNNLPPYYTLAALQWVGY